MKQGAVGALILGPFDMDVENRFFRNFFQWLTVSLSSGCFGPMGFVIEPSNGNYIGDYIHR